MPWRDIDVALLVRPQVQKAKAEHKFGWALNFTSNIKLFNNHGIFKPQVVFGHGYAGYNADGGVEITPDEDYHAVVPFQYGFVVAYDHSFSNRLTASVAYSETQEHNTAGQEYNAFHHSRYMVSQVIYHIFVNKFLIGLNYQWGRLINKNQDTAIDQRLMFSARFLVNWTSRNYGRL